MKPTDPPQFDIVGNEIGLLKWSLSIASSIIIKDEFKHNIPGDNYALYAGSDKWLTQDTEIKIREIICVEDILAKQYWFDANNPAPETLFEKLKSGLFGTGCFGIVIFIIYCVINTLIIWFSKIA